MISERIEKIIEALKMNKNQFSKALGLKNNVTIGRIINEKRAPSYDILEKIMQTFGSINANWLMTGEGEMFKNEQQESKVNRDSWMIGDKEVTQEEYFKAFTWFVFQNYKSKYDTDIKFDSFQKIATEFKIMAQVYFNIQEALDIEISKNIYDLMNKDIQKGKSSSILPDELVSIIDKYDVIYNEFLDNADIMLRLHKITDKHTNILSSVIKDFNK